MNGKQAKMCRKLTKMVDKDPKQVEYEKPGVLVKDCGRKCYQDTKKHFLIKHI